MGIIDSAAEEDVCEVNRDELELAFETELKLKGMDYSDAVFDQFLVEYGEELCLVGGVIHYVDGEVECSEHGDDSHDSDDDEVFYL